MENNVNPKDENNQIDIKTFASVVMKVGTILSAEVVPDTDKLLKLEVDFGLKEPVKTEGSSDQETTALEEREIRQIVSGIADRVTPEYLIGKQCPFVVNLAPRTIRGVESNGMIMAVGSDDSFALLHPHIPVSNGAKIR